MVTGGPIKNPPAGLRQRRRSNGWRIWWEPSAAARAKGFETVELDANQLTASVRRAKQINNAVATRTFRDLRRTAAQTARLAGASSMAVADMLGNSSDRNTGLSMTYMPASDAAAAEAVTAIAPPDWALVLPRDDSHE